MTKDNDHLHNLYSSKLHPLSSNETRNRGFTYRYQLDVIAKLKIKEDWSMKYVTEDLCKFRGVDASTGEKLFFQVDNGLLYSYFSGFLGVIPSFPRSIF